MRRRRTALPARLLLTLVMGVAALAPAGSALAATGDISTAVGTGVNSSSGDGGQATSASIMGPLGIGVGPNGDLYIPDYAGHRVRRVSSTGVITTFAGTGSQGSGGDGGPATSAQLRQPADVVVDAVGNVYIADAGNNRVRRVTPGGTITTYAGTGTAGYSGNGGPAIFARLDGPFGLELDGAGNLYIADLANDAVRKVTTGGTISTVVGTGIAGSSGDGGAATSATLNGPSGVALDPSGNLYVVEYSGNRVRKVTPGGIISRLAGNGSGSTTGDGGLATSATVHDPWGVETDDAGNVYIAELSGQVVRKVSTLGVITRFAGTTNTSGFTGDGGPALNARLNTPAAMAISPSGDGFVADYGNRRIRQIAGVGVPGAPTVTATNPVSPANGNTVQVTGTAAAGSTVTLYSNSSCTSSVVASGTAAAFGGSGISVSVADDSTTTFYATATNAAGTSPCSSASVTYVEDSTAPGGATVGSSPTSPGSGRLPSWSFSGEAGATFECRLDRGATVVSNWATCSSPRAYDLTGQADGTYTLSVRARDAAGNTGSVITSTYVLDTTAPAAPSVTSSPATPGSGRAPSWSFLGENGATYECRLERGATTVSAWGTCTSPRSYDLTGEADGTYSFAVRARDAAGNTGLEATSSYVLDTAAPATPSVTASPATPSAGESPQWSFSGDPSATLQCRLDRGGVVVSDWSTCSGSRTYGLVGEPDGSYTFAIRARDAAGNTSTPATSAYELDRAVPATPTIDTRPATPDNDPTPEWTVSGPVDATLECRLARGATLIADWGTCGSPASYDLLAELDGTYTFSVRARDAAGNSSVAVDDSFVLDRAAPAAPSIDTDAGALGSDESPAWSFSGESGASLECRLEHGNGTTVSDWAGCATSRSYDISGESDGSFVFRVRATDPAGNTGVDATSAYTLDRSLPTTPTILTAPTSPATGRLPQWTFEGDVSETFDCRLERDGALVSDWADCTSPKAYNLTGLADGSYKFLVRAEDALNRTGAAASSIYVLDTTNPAAPVIAGNPTSPGRDDTPAWSFSGEAGAAFTCRVMRGGVEVVAWNSCDSGDSFDVSGELDGVFTLEVVAEDDAGNSSQTTVSAPYTLDRAAPAQPDINVAPATPGSGRAPSWSFTGEGGATLECRLDRGATAIAGWGTCSGSRSYDLTNLADASYTFSVRARDSAGNVGAARTSTYALDTTAPAAPSFTAEPPTPDNDRTIAWSFSGEGGATFQCRLERGGTQVSDWSSCSGTRAYDLTGEPNGSYAFLVRATDAAGNTGTAGTSTYVLDTSGPADPTLDSHPVSPASDEDVSWSFSGDGAAAGYECRLRRGATVVSGWGTCSSPGVYDLSGEIDGDYTFEVLARDTVGNASGTTTDVYTLDRSAPAAPTFDQEPTTPSAGATPSWSFSGEAGAGFECRLTRGGSLVSDWASCGAPRSYDLSGEVDGAFVFAVRARDAAGNTGAAATSSFVLDRSVPAQPTIDAAPGVTGTGRNPSWSFSADSGSTLECRLERGATVVSAWGTCTSPRSFDLTGLPDGAYTFLVRARNALGTPSAARTDVYTLDTGAPAAPSILTSPGARGSSRSPSWSFTGESGATLECRLETGGAAVYDWAACTSPLAYDLSGRSDGAYAFKVRARDAAGNTGPASTETYELDTNAPAAPVLTAAPTSPGASRSPAWSWSGEGGASFECRLDRSGDAAGDWAPCLSGQPQDLSARPDGTYTLSVRARDAAGNPGPALASSYDLDTTPGGVSIVSGPAAFTRDRNPAWSFAGEVGAAFSCRLARGADVVADWAACGSPQSYDLTSRPDGEYAFSVRAADGAGNTSSPATWLFHLDTVAPAKPVVDARPPNRDRDLTPLWTFSSEPGSTVECRVDHGTELVSDWYQCSEQVTLQLKGREDGVYTLTVRAVDPAGNAGETTATAYRLDRTAPDAPDITTRPGRTGDDRKPNWGFRGESAATFECRLRRGSDVVKAWKACDSPQAYDLGDEPDGTYAFSARATDTAGNTGAAATDEYELRKATSSGGGGDSGSSGGGGDGGSSGGDAPAAPAAAPAGPTPAAPGAAPAAAPPADPETDDPGDEAADDDAEQGTEGAGGDGRGGPGGAGKPGAAGAAPGAAGAQGRAGAGGGAETEEQKRERERRERKHTPLGKAAESVAKVAAAIAEEPEKTVFPMSLIFVLLGFMTLQGRIDRNDPKLALAPVFADPDLEFRPPHDARAALES